jgi:hypothetical protein
VIVTQVSKIAEIDSPAVDMTLARGCTRGRSKPYSLGLRLVHPKAPGLAILRCRLESTRLRMSLGSGKNPRFSSGLFYLFT